MKNMLANVGISVEMTADKGHNQVSLHLRPVRQVVMLIHLVWQLNGTRQELAGEGQNATGSLVQ